MRLASLQRPQTPLGAVESGWAWLTATCACKRRGSVRFADLTISAGRAPLAGLASKMRCRKCRSRDGLKFSLGGYFAQHGQPFEHWKDIAFEGDRAVRPPRS